MSLRETLEDLGLPVENDPEFMARLRASRAQVAATVVVKPPIALDGSKGRKPCACGSTSAYAAPAPGPHWGRLSCMKCNRFLAWISAEVAISIGLVERLK